jgi:chitin disaccharide deacetylase
MRVLGTFAGTFREAVQREGFVTPDGTLGIEVTGILNGTLNETLFAAMATSVPEGTWEFVCHPGYNDSDLQTAKTRLRESREVELGVLTSPRAREILARQGIELISYRDLVER